MAANVDAALSEDDMKLQLWYPSAGVRGSFGYKDNVTLSPTAAESSTFWLTGVEGVLFRLPTHGWHFNLYASAEDTRYFDADSVENEQVATVMTQVRKDLGQSWKTTLGLNYLYQNQVFDFSTTYTGPESIGKVRGHHVSPRLALRKESGAWFGEVEMIGARQWLDAPLDSYWQAGPRLGLGRKFGAGSQVGLNYTYSRLAYDSREQADTSGNPVAGSSLTLQTHGVEMTYTQEWDQQRRWQTVTRCGFERNLDNGSGFYDYSTFRVAQHVRYRGPSWELAGHVKAGFYHYPVQTAGADTTDERKRTMVLAGVRAEKRLFKTLRVQAAYTYERSLSDQEFDSYEANIVSGGIGVEF